MFRLGLAQMTPVLGDPEANLQIHLDWIKRARQEKVDLLLFAELSLTGYHLRDLVPDVAMRSDAEPLRRLAEAAGEMSLVVGFVEESSSFQFHISAAYLEAGQARHIHRKVYLPTYGMFDEERYLDPGDKVRAFDTRFGRCAILICEDLWHPSTAYLAAMDGALYLLGVGNSPGRGVHGETLATAEIYRLVCRVYAQFFQVWCVFLNRVGFEEGVNFWGGSIVANPMGEICAQAPLLEEALLTAQLDDSEVRRARIFAPLLGSERLELTLRELDRIARERAE